MLKFKHKYDFRTKSTAFLKYSFLTTQHNYDVTFIYSGKFILDLPESASAISDGGGVCNNTRIREIEEVALNQFDDTPDVAAYAKTMLKNIDEGKAKLHSNQ